MVSVTDRSVTLTLYDLSTSEPVDTSQVKEMWKGLGDSRALKNLNK